MVKMKKEEIYKAIKLLRQAKIIDGQVEMAFNSMVFKRFRKEIIESLPIGLRQDVSQELNA